MSTNPYIPKQAGDIMLAADWNEMQVQARTELHGHRHTGGDDAEPIGAAGIAPQAIDGRHVNPAADIAAKSLSLSSRSILAEIDKLIAAADALGKTKLDRAGDTLAGGLSVQKDLTVEGLSTLKQGLTVYGAFGMTGASTLNGPLSVIGDLRLNDKATYLRAGTDTNHGLAYCGTTKPFGALAVDGPVLFGYAGGALGTTATGPKTALSWDALGNLKWANSRLLVDQGGSLELGGTNATPGSGTPFIDFHFSGKTEDFNTRIINNADGQLSLYAAQLNISGIANVAGATNLYGALTVAGSITAHGSFHRFGLDSNGGGQLLLTNNPNDNRIYIEAFNSSFNGSATELLLTGASGGALPQLTLMASTTTATGHLRAASMIVDTGVADHVVTDGSFYRWSGQVYINVDDNLYIRDSSRGIRMHFDTTNGVFKTDVLRLGDKFRFSGVGDDMGKDDWLRMTNVNNSAFYYGGIAAGRLWTAQGVLAGSDLRLKNEIVTIPSALAKVAALRGVTFNWNTVVDGTSAGRESGLIAQEVEAVFPEVVTDGPDGFKGINYNGLIGLLVEAIKEQQAMIDALLARAGLVNAASANLS